MALSTPTGMASEDTTRTAEGTTRTLDELRVEAMRILYQRIIEMDPSYLHDLAHVAAAIKAVNES